MQNKPVSCVAQLVDVFAHTEKEGVYQKDVPKIAVNEVVSRIAFLYEKIRTVVDFKEEHLLRKDAIRRSLDRRMLMGTQGTAIAGPLIMELIRAGYLENKLVPQEKVVTVANVINRYVYLVNVMSVNQPSRERKKWRKWLIDIASVELEEELSPNPKQNALVECMYRSISANFVTKNEKLSEEEKNILVYVAILRVLTKANRATIEYLLLKLYYPNWRTLDISNSRKIRKEMAAIREKIDSHVDHPLNRYFSVRVKKYTPLFVILQDVVEKDPDNAMEILSNPEDLENAVEQACNDRYEDQKARINRSIVRSLMYIFMTKMLLALAIEVPIDYYFYEDFNYLPVTVNILFHPLFLATLVLTAKKPGSDNTEKIILGIKEIVYGYENEGGPHEIKRKPRKRGFGAVVFNVLYAILFAVSFGAIIFILRKIGFHAPSIGLFLLFLSMVSFFGIKIRQSAKELIVLDKKERISTLPFDLLALPLVRAGRWISLNFSRVNLFVFFLDVIIEAPFKALIEVFEDWLSFLREKKEEIYRETN
jgi:hypothetical protein